MLFLIGKFLQVALRPILLGLAALFYSAWSLRKTKGPGRWFVGGVAVALLVLSIPAIPLFYTAHLENAYPSFPISEYPSADAILVLGGSTNTAIFSRYEPEEDQIHEGRLLAANRLFKAKKAPLIFVTGGLPYLGARGKPRTLAGDMAQVLMDMGVPESAVVATSGSRNTQEDVAASLKVLQAHKVHTLLFVTDALHMRRAMTFFAGCDLLITPVPVDRNSVDLTLGLMSFIPDASALDGTNAMLHEAAGYVVARLVSLGRHP